MSHVADSIFDPDCVVAEELHRKGINDDTPPPFRNHEIMRSMFKHSGNGVFDRCKVATLLFDEDSEEGSYLFAFLEEVWTSKSFHKIGNLEMLWSAEFKATKQSSDVSPISSLREAFTQAYQGSAVDGFYDYLVTNDEKFTESTPSRYYAKFCSIVQSSGTGKSRMMTELPHKNVMVLYMNLRPADDSKNFPLRDEVPARILTEGLNTTTVDYEIRCCAFFTAVFKTLREDLLRSLERVLNDFDQAVRLWNADMHVDSPEARNEFFERVRSECEKLCTSTTTKDAVNVDFANIMKKAYSDFVKVLPECDFVDHRPKLVIAIDEAHTLTWSAKDHFRPLTVLCRAISTYSCLPLLNFPIWVVFASTTSKVVDFSAPQTLYDSARVAEGGELLFPPYTLLGWDHKAFPCENISADETANLCCIVSFGRPLWSSMISPELTVVDLVNLAMLKLCGSKGFIPSDVNHMIAVLGQRFALEICFGHPESVKYLERGVASHLRICLSTTQDRMWSFTSYPSEPFLSCVAALTLLGEKPVKKNKSHSQLKTSLRTLRDKIYDGMVDKGEAGELVSRLLWLLAKDLYVRTVAKPYRNLFYAPPGADEWDGELIDCRPIKVLEYLEFVFGKQEWDEAAREAFENAFINFSHWVSMDSDIAGNDANQLGGDSWTLHHWNRTSAVQCHHQQKLVDKMIPIYFSNSKQVSQIFISDKATTSGNSSDLPFICRGDPSINCATGVAYIAILVDLGTSKSQFDAKWYSCRDNDGPSLRIYAATLNNTTFPSLANYGIIEELRDLATPSTPNEPAAVLRKQVEFGRTPQHCHMCWELRGEHLGPAQQEKQLSKKRRKRRNRS